MKRLAWALGVVAVLLATLVVVGGGHPMRLLVGAVSGAEALAYLPPRREIARQAGPPQPTLSLAEAGVDPGSVELAVRYAETRNTSALVIGVNGHVVYQKFWDGLSLDSEVELSDFTPVLAALVLGTARQNGEIRDIDTPLANYFAEWAQDPRGTITFRDLLTGNSNLAKPGGRTWPGSLAARYHATGDLRTTLLAWPQAAKPDRAGSPPDVDADVLALALSRALGADYARLLDERIFEPLGAGSFSAGIDSSDDVTAQVRAGCCLRARLSDWMRIGALIANGGFFEGNQLSPPDYARLLVTPAYKGSARAVFLRVDGQYAAHDVLRLEATGKQRLWMVPSLKLVILRTGSEPPEGQGWDEAMIPDNIIRGTRGWEPGRVDADGKVDPSQYAPH